MNFAAASPRAAHAWGHFENGWRELYDDFERGGLSVEWHEFKTARPLDWGMSFRPESIEFCLNLAGRGVIGARSPSDYVAGSAGYYAVADEPLPARREGGERHQFVTVEFSRARLQEQLSAHEEELEAQVRRAIFPGKKESVVSTPQPMGTEQRAVVASLLQPPVARAAQSLWYQSKALELMAHFFFTPKDPELFCMRQKRVARDRVERMKELLLRDLANPPTLEALGQEVGCSPFYLSRIFSREVGLTIPQFLRNQRMERAAELLRSGRYNVTEAATEVGYASLSHFSKAFCETIGCCPALYPMAKHVVLDR